MAELQKKATRESYGEALRDLAEKYPELVVLDADLAAATKTGIFKKAYPERFFDCGIAEANMMGVAAVCPPQARFRLPALSLCSPQAEHLRSSATLLVTRI